MSSGNDETGDNPSYALTTYERKALTETRTFSKKCESKIREDKENFAEKGAWGLWWDAKGLFNSSDKEEVTLHMEKYRGIYVKIYQFSALVEKGDTNSYDELLDIYKDLEEMERDAKRDVANNRSSAVCRMLRGFLNEKYNLDHNLKKVECVVLKQKMSEVEQTCKSSKEAVIRMSDKMGKLLDENRGIREFMEQMKVEKEEQALEAEKRSEAIRLESDQKLDELLKENRGIREVIEVMRIEKEELEKRGEAVRRESDEKLATLIEENRGIKEVIEAIRKEKEALVSESDRRSEAIRLESDEKLKQVLKEAEERSEDRIRQMKEESDSLRLEAERIRRESEEQLKRAVEEANRRSEARMLEMAEQNRASLQKMTKLLEGMNLG